MLIHYHNNELLSKSRYCYDFARALFMQMCHTNIIQVLVFELERTVIPALMNKTLLRKKSKK